MQKRTKFDILDEIAHHKKILQELETELEAKNSVVEVIGESPIQPTTKRLKISFWKAEKALAMQILEQEGLPKVKSDGFVNIVTISAIYKDTIYLRGDRRKGDFNIDGVLFETNSERDECLDKVIKAITDELFTSNGELKIGEMCEVSDDKLNWNSRIYAGKSAKELGLERRVLAVHGYNERMLTRWRHARPISKRVEPKVEECGEIVTYTWEE
jgi:hypothetical protein